MWVWVPAGPANANYASVASPPVPTPAQLWSLHGASASNAPSAKAISSPSRRASGALPCHGLCCDTFCGQSCDMRSVLSTTRATSFASSGRAWQRGSRRFGMGHACTSSQSLIPSAAEATPTATSLTVRSCSSSPQGLRAQGADQEDLRLGGSSARPSSQGVLNGRRLWLGPTAGTFPSFCQSGCTGILQEAKPHLTDLPQPYHELGPTMKLVLDMWLPLLPLERLVDMLGEFLAMASEAEVEEEPSEQHHYPEQAAVKRATTPTAVKPGANTWPIGLLHRVYPRGQQSSFSHQNWQEFLKGAECGLLSPAKYPPRALRCWSL